MTLPPRFDWNEHKAAVNLRKHSVSFTAAALIFKGPVFAKRDVRYDYGEEREIGLGESKGRILEVVFTQRGDTIRIISAWPAGRDARREYQDLLAGGSSPGRYRLGES